MAASTIDEILDGLDANADFEETNSVAKARAYITWSIKFIQSTPSSQSDQGSSLSMSLQEVRQMQTIARSFVQQASTDSAATSRVRFLSARTGWR